MYIDFDPIPCDESMPKFCDCIVQRRLGRVLRNQLVRMFGTGPKGTRYTNRFNDHDFGGYITLRLTVPDTDEGAEYLHKVDENFPAEWDKEAKEEFALMEK